MKPRAVLAASVVAALIAATPARAQPAAPLGGGGWILLGNKSVQRELKATEDQARALEAHLAVAQQRLAFELKNAADLPPAERATRIRAAMGDSDAKLHAALAEVLRPEQVERFDQVALPVAGLGAFSVERVRAALRLDRDQAARIDELQSRYRDATLGLRGVVGGERQSALERLAATQRRLVVEAEAALTPEQGAAWKALAGEPFELETDPIVLPE